MRETQQRRKSCKLAMHKICILTVLKALTNGRQNTNEDAMINVRIIRANATVKEKISFVISNRNCKTPRYKLNKRCAGHMGRHFFD